MSIFKDGASQHATPLFFRPGERWLISYFIVHNKSILMEARCLERSPSRTRVKIEPIAPNAQPYWTDGQFYLLERLPDESNDDKAAATAGTVEGDSAKPCEREDCRRIRQELTQRIIREAAQEIPEGKTFTVATQAESAAQSEHNGTD